MNLSAAGLALIKQAEGFRGKVYRDINGLPTIGYGHKVHAPESFPNGVTEAEATAMLVKDVSEAERAVRRLVRTELTQGQFDALVDFCFNLGQGRLAASKLLADLNAGRYDRAAEQLLLWDHAGSKEVAALRARREAEFRLWHGPAGAAMQNRPASSLVSNGRQTPGLRGSQTARRPASQSSALKA